MREPVHLFVDGEPKGQPRPRACIRGKRAGVYDPGTAAEWKKAIAEAWHSKVAPENAPAFRPFETALFVSLSFYMPRPKSHYNAKGLLKPSAPEFHTSKPDVDNLQKAVLDALTDVGAWTDDKLVCRSMTRREWADSRSGCYIIIREHE